MGVEKNLSKKADSRDEILNHDITVKSDPVERDFLMIQPQINKLIDTRDNK